MPTNTQMALAIADPENWSRPIRCCNHCYGGNLVWDIQAGFHWRGNPVSIGIVECRDCGFGLVYMHNPSDASYWAEATISILRSSEQHPYYVRV